MIQQKIGGDIVVYIANGKRLNATVLQSNVITIDGQEEENLVLSVPRPEKFSQVMSGQQIQDALEIIHGVRPFEKTKTDVEGAPQGSGWANVEAAASDPEVLKDGPLLKDLVSEINAGNPIDAYGKDLKDNEKFKAAASHLGVELTPYDKGDVHAQIVRQLQHDGIKPSSPRVPNADSNGEVASAEVATGDSIKGEGGEPEMDIAEKREALYDPSKAAGLIPQDELDQMSPEAREAVERGELHPSALNAKPEEHPEFGTADLAEPENQKTPGEYVDDGSKDDDRE